MAAHSEVLAPRDVASLVSMAELLCALGFVVNMRIRRCACILHSGSNPTAFSWRDDGRWYCFHCNQGGDRIALVRAVKNCGFHEAILFLARLAGVSYESHHISRRQIEAAKRQRQHAEAAAWRIRDRVLWLNSYYRGGLHRAEHLWRKLGAELLRAGEGEREALWDRMAHLCPICTFFLAGFYYLNSADAATLARFVLASPAQRRALIFGDSDAYAALHAA